VRRLPVYAAMIDVEGER